MTEQEKFEKLIDVLGVTAYRLSKDLKMSTERINKIIRGETKSPSVAIYAKIKTAYPQVSSDWLITGTGEVLNSEAPTVDSSYQEKIQKLETENQFLQNLYEKAISEKISLQSGVPLKKFKGAILCPDPEKRFRVETAKRTQEIVRSNGRKGTLKSVSARVPESLIVPSLKELFQRP